VLPARLSSVGQLREFNAGLRTSPGDVDAETDSPELEKGDEVHASGERDRREAEVIVGHK
jgi:hypothetical protein